MGNGLGDCKRLRNTFELDEVNKALAAGWTLVAVAPDQDETKFPITKYTVGHHLSDEEALAAKSAKAKEKPAPKRK